MVAPTARADAAPPADHAAAEHLRLLSRPDWVEPVVLYLKRKALEAGVDESAANRLVVAMTEAVTNAIVHGNFALSSALKQQGDGAFKQALDHCADDPDLVGRVVDIQAEYSPEHCTWTITDEGAGFDVAQALARLESDDPMELLASGRGISIIKAFVDQVQWSEGGRRIELTIDMARGRERRQAERVRYTETVQVQCEQADADLNAMARDLSETGIAFVCEQPLPVDAAVTVTLDATRPEARPVTGRIVRCGKLAGPYHDVAVQFHERQSLPAGVMETPDAAT